MLDVVLKYRIIIGQVLAGVAGVATLLLLRNYAEWDSFFSFAVVAVVYLAVPPLWNVFLGILQGRY